MLAIQTLPHIKRQNVVMLENLRSYKLVRRGLPQTVRNRVRYGLRLLLDAVAAMRGLDSRRALPDFLIVGAQKAGTTSLFNWLVKSGVAQSPLLKEVHYFDARWRWPVNYRGYFAPRKEASLIGEATPSYLAFPEVPERAVKVLGSECKIIILLRHPVDRAVSHYFHNRRLGLEKRDMYTAMGEEERLIEEAFEPGTSATRRRYILANCSYVYRSRYSERIAPWIEHFGKHNVMIVNSERMFLNPGQTVHSVARFLSAKVSKAVDFNAKNTGSYTFDNPLVAAYLADKLQAEVEAYENWSYGDIESDAIDVPDTTAIPADLDSVA